MKIETFFDKVTFTATYVVSDPKTKDAVIIDPVLDFDPPSGKVTTASLGILTQAINEADLKVCMILETHAHADHLSSSQYLKKLYPQAVLAISMRITEVQKTFQRVFNLPHDFPVDGRQFDRLLQDGETVSAGSLRFQVIPTPGHTPACSSFLFDGAVFTGDALFMPDFGTGRCDFPLGSAEQLYHSIFDRLYTLPDQTRVFVGHDYAPGGREYAVESTIAQEKASNIHLTAQTSKDAFVKMRTERDKQLSAPRLLLPSIQVNMAAGHLPTPEANGVSYLKLPLSLSL